MGTKVDESNRFVPFLNHSASANAYLALTGVLGLLFWGATAYFRATGFPDVSWAGLSGTLVIAWAVLWVGRWLLAAVRVDRGVWLSKPAIVWMTVTVGAFGASAYGLGLGFTPEGTTLLWAPWAVAFAIGYLATGVLVQRGRIYLLAGVASLGILVAGLLFDAPAAALFVALGLVHGVPMLIDAARGGRQLDENGLPALRGATEQGGRVPQ